MLDVALVEGIQTCIPKFLKRSLSTSRYIFSLFLFSGMHWQRCLHTTLVYLAEQDFGTAQHNNPRIRRRALCLGAGLPVALP